MKLFDPRAALAEIEKQALPPATSATSATQTPKTTSKPANVANVADVAAPPAQIQKNTTSPDRARIRAPSYGLSAGGRPRTWTGRVVSLDAWRQLSEGEKHGPNGRHLSIINNRIDAQKNR